MRASYVAAFLALCSVAYALPTPSPLPGSVVMPNYGISGTVANPPPTNAAMALYRGVSEAEATTTGVVETAGFYMEHARGGSSVHPWGVYSEVRSNHALGADAVALYGRLRNDGTGWGAAIHAEPIATGTGTTIGVNVEASPMGTGRVLGINVQAKNGYGTEHPGVWTNEGINLQSDPGVSYVDGIRYECSAWTGMHFAPTSQTTRAIWIQGTHVVGIDTSAPIRLQAGVPLQLEGTAQVQLVFDHGRIEFRNGARVLAYIAIDGTANGARIN